MPAAANRLIAELSPYLRQHAHNPVDWYPWGDEAFALARAARRPVLLSIGYSACHWCHVMAHESFEDPTIAAVMNEHFVNVKVDREERPDVDAVYMSAVQAMTGSGGWPLTVFLTPEGEPFYGGTYFPPTDRGGTPSFGRVLDSLALAWGDRRDEVALSAARLAEHLKGLERTFGSQAGPVLDVQALVAEAVAALAAAEDEGGGFGDAPKFPPHAALAFLSSVPDPAAAALVERTLDAMAAGGVHDHLGGGFFRYSVDRHWRLPHFEKMLSDNAQLLRAYLGAARAGFAYAGGGSADAQEPPAVPSGVRDPGRHRRVATRIIAWLEREMAVVVPGAPAEPAAAEPPTAGDAVAFFTATDADSEGEEGRFYAWSESEFRAVVRAAEDRRAATAEPDGLTPDDVARLAAEHFGVTAAGTFEGGNVLRRARSAVDLSRAHGVATVAVEAALGRASTALFEQREARARPATDDKVLTSLNGLLLAALADAGRLLDDGRITLMARGVATFLRRHLWRDGRLLHVWRQGEARVEGFLEDYAYLGLGLLAYYRATFEPWALAWAFDLADQCESRFADLRGGGYFSTASDAAPLLVRPKGQTDGATPSESVAAGELVWWAARYRSDGATADRVLDGLRGVEQGVRVAPQAFASGLRLLALAARPSREVVLCGTPGAADLAELVDAFRRHDDGTAVALVVTGADHPLAGLPLLTGRVGRPGAPASAYVCHAGVCDLPVGDGAALSALLGAE